MTVGETLKRARKKLNLELDDVAEATKIAKMFLIALENDDIEVLPRGVYAKNFLRAYAKFLKLDEDILTSEFHQQFSLVPHFVAQQEQTKRDDAQFRRQRLRMQFTVLIVIVVLSAVGYYLWLTYQATRSQDSGFLSSLGNRTAAAQDGGQDPAVQVQDPILSQDSGGETSEPAPTPDSGETAENAPALAQPEVPNASEQKRLPPEDTDQAPAAESRDEIAGGEELIAPELSPSLPLLSLDGQSVLPEGSAAEGLNRIFAIHALESVWVSVTIDGQDITRRELPAGATRIYQYGSVQTVNIGDTSKVSIQSGPDYRAQADRRNFTVLLRDFGSGELFQALDQRILQIMQQNRQSEDGEQ